MPRERRAMLFDLDGTLYPLSRYRWSGLAAVAEWLAETRGLAAADVRRVLLGAFRGDARGRELQACLSWFALPPTLLPAMVDLVRVHRPRLALPAGTRRVLDRLRGTWRLAIVTNGDPARQARKVAALGLAPLVDTVVYAHQVAARGKPDPSPFLEAVRRVGVPLGRVVIVGDDPATDLAGAARLGVPAIHLVRGGAVPAPGGGAAMVSSIGEVPHVAEGLVEGDGGVHVV